MYLYMYMYMLYIAYMYCCMCIMFAAANHYSAPYNRLVIVMLASLYIKLFLILIVVL